ncbi:hypothetical protein KEM48_004779 [Puccinia striiformis f. sp. tritici PST-130]|nr:hypothetical protein KEM48_004779 [Puccinia striiformis f. sp. tritici PST-130]
MPAVTPFQTSTLATIFPKINSDNLPLDTRPHPAIECGWLTGWLTGGSHAGSQMTKLIIISSNLNTNTKLPPIPEPPGSSSNLYDPINVPYLLTSQPDNLYQSSSAPTQFASFSHLASGSQHDRSASNSYDPMSSYNPADSGLPDSFAPIPPQDTQRHIQGNFRNNNHDSGSYSGPSTAGSMWTTAEDMSTPLLTGDFHDLMSSLSAPAENLRRDDSQVLNF